MNRGGIEDHIHILCDIPPRIAGSNMLRSIKASSSKWIKEHRHCTIDFKWQRGLAAFSVSKSNIPEVTRYPVSLSSTLPIVRAMRDSVNLLLLIRLNGRWEMGSLASWSVLMKTILIPLVSILAVFATAQIKAGDHFLQMRCERSRRCLPRYDYQASKATAVSAVISEPAIVIVTPAAPGSADPATPNAQHVSRAFVFDELRAGPLVLSSLSAKTDGTGRIRVSGVLNHTGGDSGQLLGGKAVICVEPLTATGSTAKNATTLAVQDDGDWVRRNQPKTVQMDVQYENTHPWTFGDVERVRVFLEYYPSR